MHDPLCGGVLPVAGGRGGGDGVALGQVLQEKRMSWLPNAINKWYTE